MATPSQHPIQDEVARQRRKREARLLDQEIADRPGVTLADLVADVYAASEGGRVPLDVRHYLHTRGHGWRTIEAVMGHLDREDHIPSSDIPSSDSQPLRLL